LTSLCGRRRGGGGRGGGGGGDGGKAAGSEEHLHAHWERLGERQVGDCRQHHEREPCQKTNTGSGVQASLAAAAAAAAAAAMAAMVVAGA